MFRWRLLSSVGLSVLFLVAYSGTNWLSARRVGVPSCYFAWEVAIPFIPAMILPYMSIDLFFVFAPFLTRDLEELAAFTRRIAFSIMFACACFLLFPLKFSFTRPQTDGWLGAIFDWFRTMDQPFNQLPSLHVTLAALLLEIYLRYFKSTPARLLLIGWFALIASSTVFTFQHHVIDVVGGVMLALVAMARYPYASPAEAGSPQLEAARVRVSSNG